MTTASSGEPVPERGGAYTYGGQVTFQYAPELDREPDPGEVVWSWVAFEEDASQGKDRPIAIIGRTPDGRFAALMMSSRDHDGDRRWVSIGAGPWDREGRESWLRTDRVLAVQADAVRREGAVMTPAVYERVVLAMGASASGTLGSSLARLAPPRRFARLRRLFGRS